MAALGTCGVTCTGPHLSHQAKAHAFSRQRRVEDYKYYIQMTNFRMYMFFSGMFSALLIAFDLLFW